MKQMLTHAAAAHELAHLSIVIFQHGLIKNLTSLDTDYHFPPWFAFQAAEVCWSGVKWCFLTFPDEDLSVGAVVQDEAVVTNQQLLPKRTLLRHFGQRHGTCGVGHLRSDRTQVYASHCYLYSSFGHYINS